MTKPTVRKTTGSDCPWLLPSSRLSDAAFEVLLFLRPHSHESEARAGMRGTGPSPVSGFSMLEMAVVISILLVIAAIAVPQMDSAVQSYRASSSAHSIASQLALAKMRAADDFTQTQLNCNLAGNSCQLQVCTSKGASTCNTFSAEGGPVLLPEGTSFGFGAITTPAGTQTAIQNTAQITFNSRGIPIDNTGALTGSDALYVTDQEGDAYAVTLYASGKVETWRYSGGAWSMQ